MLHSRGLFPIDINHTNNCIFIHSGRIVKQKAAATKKHGGIVRRKPAAIIDARNKIIQKHRSKIHDARDKLAQIAKRNGDVRKKLLRKGIDSQHNFSNRQYTLEKTSVAAATAAAASQRAPQKPLRRPYKPSYIEHDIRMDVEAEYMPALRRTVKNDVAYASRMPPLPTFKHIDDPRQQMIENCWSSGGGGGGGIGADPFDCYEVPSARPYDVSEPRNLNRQMTAPLPQKTIRRVSPEPVRYRYTDVPAISQRVAVSNSAYDRYRDGNGPGQLSYEMRSRLHHLPNPSQSMGIFSNPYAIRTSDDGKQKQGYRIVVSNLHSSVSQNDVKVINDNNKTINRIRNHFLESKRVSNPVLNTQSSFNLFYRNYLKTLANYWKPVW